MVFEGTLKAALKEQQHTSIPFSSLFSPTAESFGVSAQIGSGVVRGGPEVRFHEGSTKVSQGFHKGSTGFHGVLRGLRGGASTKKSTACSRGYHLSLFFEVVSPLSPGRNPLNAQKWLWLKKTVPEWNPKWKHGPKPALCPAVSF